MSDRAKGDGRRLGARNCPSASAGRPFGNLKALFGQTCLPDAWMPMDDEGVAHRFPKDAGKPGEFWSPPDEGPALNDGCRGQAIINGRRPAPDPATPMPTNRTRSGRLRIGTVSMFLRPKREGVVSGQRYLAPAVRDGHIMRLSLQY
jgi:hypothetical protein